MNNVIESNMEREEEFGVLLGEIFRLASIKRLIIVDDDYAHTELPPDEIIAKALTNLDLFIEIIPDLASIEQHETDLISDTITNAINDPSIRESASKLCKDDADEIATDENTTNAIDRLVSSIPHDKLINFQKMSSKKWTESIGAVLDESKELQTLVLFDRDFGREGKDKNHGLDLISDLIKTSDHNVFCALLSHTVSSDNELLMWHQLSEEHGIDRDRFIVIAKTRLAEEKPDFPGFLRLLRLSILCKPLKDLRSKILLHYQDAITSTGDQLAKWSIFDFDEAIFGSSRKEGLWEGDTLLRVMTTFTARSARKSVLKDSSVRALISHARAASSINIPSDETTTWNNVGEMALDYQRSESYTFQEDLNTHNIPIEAGDVFRCDNGGSEFVLLAQPCDLMIRKDGNRSYDNKHTRMVPVCQIKANPPGGNGKNGFCYELPHWSHDGKPAYVLFREVHLVSLAVIDLVVFNKSGKAKFTTNFEPPEELTHSWIKHFEKLKLHFEKEHTRISQIIKFLDRSKDLMEPGLKQFGKSKLLPQCSNTNKFNIKLTKNGFEANLKRVRRISSPIANDVLRAYSRFQSRTAFEQSLVTEDLMNQLETP